MEEDKRMTIAEVYSTIYDYSSSLNDVEIRKLPYEVYDCCMRMLDFVEKHGNALELLDGVNHISTWFDGSIVFSAGAKRYPQLRIKRKKGQVMFSLIFSEKYYQNVSSGMYQIPEWKHNEDDQVMPKVNPVVAFFKKTFSKLQSMKPVPYEKFKME